jgi:hypothetical protein
LQNALFIPDDVISPNVFIVAHVEFAFLFVDVAHEGHVFLDVTDLALVFNLFLRFLVFDAEAFVLGATVKVCLLEDLSERPFLLLFPHYIIIFL